MNADRTAEQERVAAVAKLPDENPWEVAIAEAALYAGSDDSEGMWALRAKDVLHALRERPDTPDWVTADLAGSLCRAFSREAKRTGLPLKTYVWEESVKRGPYLFERWKQVRTAEMRAWCLPYERDIYSEAGPTLEAVLISEHGSCSTTSCRLESGVFQEWANHLQGPAVERELAGKPQADGFTMKPKTGGVTRSVIARAVLQMSKTRG